MKRIFPETMNFIGATVLLIFLFGQFAFTEHTEDDPAIHQWHAPTLPAEISFAGEAAPLNRWDIKERLDREVLFNFYNQANILFLLKLSNRYFPIISARLKANGVPDDFKYLCVAESNLQSTALSPSGAVSFWQFMNSTAPGYNLKVNSEVDERYNIEKATDAACQYLKQAYAKFGSWTAAAASYNCGQAGYNNRAIEQRTKNYYDLFLPEETNRYIFRILAFKHLLENAQGLGFSLKDEEKYDEIPFRMVRIDSSIVDMVQFAMNNGTTYKMLRLMNPWIRGKSLTVNSGNAYEIKLPMQ
jgi:membrane-bound lytic murein transglycosylase D